MSIDLNHLYAILHQCTTQVRIGEVLKEQDVGPLHVTTVDAMPSEADLVDGLVIIDLVLLKVAVHPAKAEAHKAEFISLIEPLRAELEPGPSYIAIGALIGDQGTAFQLMALGEVLGLWKVITPRTLGMKDEAIIQQAAGNGYIMISGYRRPAEDEITQTEREAGAADGQE
jgi:hypothetical protein